MMFKAAVIFQLLAQLAYCYAPSTVDCPSGSLLREATNISSSEASWLTKRDAITQANLVDFLANRAKLNESEYSSFLNDSDNMKLSMAFSGGGFRAMLTGAGQLAALDSRTNGANESGLGGLLDSATYISGLSGGSWLVGSLAMNNWTSVQSIIDNDVSLWELDNVLYNMGSSYAIYSYFLQWMSDIKTKKQAGFPVTFLDIWGRIISDALFPASEDYGVNITFSGLQDFETFTNGKMPLPMFVSDAIINSYGVTAANSTLFEINPFEFGSWDNTTKSFTQTKYLGSNVNNGYSINGSCVAGFDNGGFLMGSSSNIFYSLMGAMSGSSNALVTEMDTVLEMAYKYLNQTQDNNTFKSLYEPNPFYNSDDSNYTDITTSTSLGLGDGGDDAEGIPFEPLLQPQRNVDVIFAFDSSSDTTDSWPNGNSLVSSYERQFSSDGSGAAFPYVPSSAGFVAQNLTSKPTFFGCNASNLTSLANIPPLVVYIANKDYSFASNTSTTKLAYTDADKYSMIQNGFETATRNNFTDDADWATCVGCAIIRRSQERAGIEQSEACMQCFSEYCWDGSTDEEETSDATTSTTSTTATNSSTASTSASASSSSASGKKNAAGALSNNNMLLIAGGVVSIVFSLL